MRLDEARARIRERAELNAFISVSDEQGDGTVVAVKDLVDVKGMVTTAGGVLLPSVPATEDAPVITRIRRAGGIVVGKANLHEFAYGVTSVNPHYGPVLNPHDPDELHDLGVLCIQADRPGEAIDPLQAYLDTAPPDDRAQEVRALLEVTRHRVAQWN